jgi:hypothetical protein
VIGKEHKFGHNLIWFCKKYSGTKADLHLFYIHTFLFTDCETCTGVLLFSIHRFSYAEKECVLAYLWFVSTDFYLQAKIQSVLQMISFYRFLFTADKGTRTGVQLVSLQDDYLHQAKGHVLEYSWSPSKMFICSRQRSTY